MQQFNRILFVAVILLGLCRKCITDYSVGFRIIGGRATTIVQVPYMVSITYHDDHICGAALVKPNIVLSAAHCFPHSHTNPRAIKLYYEAHAGMTYLVEESLQSIRLKSVLKHPQFNADTYDNDISVTWLMGNFEYGLKIQPIELPTPDSPLPIGEEALVAGWGATKYLGQISDELQAVSVRIHNQSLCQGIYKERMTSNMFCAGNYLAERDACMGDSGGPLVYDYRVLIGIVSWGKNCGEIRYPGVYTNVAKMRPWLDKYISTKR